MSSASALRKAGAETPDDHCASCGAGIFFSARLIDGLRGAAKLAHASRMLTEAPHPFIEGGNPDLVFASYNVCAICSSLEGELIEATGTANHPERVASYDRMMERFS